MNNSLSFALCSQRFFLLETASGKDLWSVWYIDILNKSPWLGVGKKKIKSCELLSQLKFLRSVPIPVVIYATVHLEQLPSKSIDSVISPA